MRERNFFTFCSDPPSDSYRTMNAKLPTPISHHEKNNGLQKAAPGNTITFSSTPSRSIPKSFTIYSANSPALVSLNHPISKQLITIDPATPPLTDSTNPIKSSPTRFANTNLSLKPTKFAPTVIRFPILQLCPQPSSTTHVPLPIISNNSDTGALLVGSTTSPRSLRPDRTPSSPSTTDQTSDRCLTILNRKWLFLATLAGEFTRWALALETRQPSPGFERVRREYKPLSGHEKSWLYPLLQCRSSPHGSGWDLHI